jgi:hypothetical protein
MPLLNCRSRLIHQLLARLGIAVAAVALAGVAGGMWALAADAAPSAPARESKAADPASNWVASADGTHVLDMRSQLAWPRCVEGMLWTGKTCVGSVALFDRAEASALAAERARAKGVAWRLPRAAEMARLVDKAATPPGLNPVLFPAAPGGWHWTATSNVNAMSANAYNYGTVMEGRSGELGRQATLVKGWAINVSTGEARGDTARSSRLPVRLVRPMVASDTAR